MIQVKRWNLLRLLGWDRLDVLGAALSHLPRPESSLGTVIAIFDKC